MAIHDATAHLLRRETVHQTPFTLHRNNLPAGLYFWKLSSEDGREVGSGRLVVLSR